MKHDKERCLVISGGPLDLTFAKQFLENRQYGSVIAVDAGVAACSALGIVPDLLVGDFDTYGREKIQKEYPADSEQIRIHRPEKDETDTELAFSEIQKLGYTQVDVLGATGGRLDHELANMHLLAHCRKKGMQVRLYDRQNCVYILDAAFEGQRKFRRNELYGSYVSFLPLTPWIRGMTLQGFRYPLTDYELSLLEQPGLCVSNEILEDEAWLFMKEGILICVESKDR